MGDEPCAEVDQNFMRSISGVIVRTPSILHQAFSSPFTWTLRGFFNIARPTPRLVLESFLAMAHRVFNPRRRCHYLFHAAVLIALHTLWEVSRNRGGSWMFGEVAKDEKLTKTARFLHLSLLYGNPRAAAG